MAALMPALLAKYDALSAAGFPDSTIPTAYEDRAPEIVNGAQLYPPYVVFQLFATEEILTFESDGIENHRLVITAYADDQSKSDQTIKAIRFNNQNPDQTAGFENAATLATLTEGVLQAIILTRPPVPNIAGRGREGAIIKKTTVEFAVSVQRS